MDVAAAMQETLEKIVLHVLSFYRKETGLDFLCLAGGVSLNSKLTGSILYSDTFKDVFVQPAAADNGLSLGSALRHHHKVRGLDENNEKLETIYLGHTNLTNKNLYRTLSKWEEYLNFIKDDKHIRSVAEYIAEDKVIGWFQGSGEFGPRALGNRSILANPRNKNNKKRVNSLIKMRDGFRPFAPSILEEHVEDYFELPNNMKKDYDYMTFVLTAKEGYAEKIPAVVHVDGTSRVQTVSNKKNLKFWKLINEFKDITGIPALLNTSFNNNTEPIVQNYQDAIRCFCTTNLDVLCIEDFLISKSSHFSKWTGNFNISTVSHVIPRKESNIFYLTDKYLKTTTNISNELYNLLEKGRDQVVFETNQTQQLKKEIFKIWSLRLIDLVPRV